MTADATGAGPARGPLLELAEVSRTRGDRRVLDRVSFALDRGRVLAVLGPSGAGKSTLLSVIAGLEPADEGRIALDGRDASGVEPAARGVAIAFDDAALHETLRLRENLEAATLPLGLERGERRRRAESLAKRLGVSHALDRRTGSLSAGERRRASVGRVLAREPRVALLDEPFANLDRANRDEIRALIRVLRDEIGAATIVVTHDATDALAIADEILVLVAGRARTHGRATEVWSKPVDLEVARLVDDLGMAAIPWPAATGVRPGPSLAARLAAVGTGRPLLIGVRAADWRMAADGSEADRSDPSRLEVDLDILAHEPAGVFTDLVGTVSGAPVRARLGRLAAQELPTRGAATLAAHGANIHLFDGAAPFPRLD